MVSKHVWCDQTDDTAIISFRLNHISRGRIGGTNKLHIHVVEVVMEMAFDLMARLNISESKTHPIGARVLLLIHRITSDVPKGETYRTSTRNLRRRCK